MALGQHHTLNGLDLGGGDEALAVFLEELLSLRDGLETIEEKKERGERR
jgi:hypothetical protein